MHDADLPRTFYVESCFYPFDKGHQYLRISIFYRVRSGGDLEMPLKCRKCVIETMPFDFLMRMFHLSSRIVELH